MIEADSVLSTPPTNTSANNRPGQPMTHDDELGMAWWNALSEQDRAKWSAIAGNTGRPKDAWEAFKRGSGDQSPPVDQARRRFLAVAAGASVIGAGSLAVAALPAAARDSTTSAIDPIFAAIEVHREAKAMADAAYAESSRLHRLADEVVGPSKIEIPNMAEPGTTVEAWLHIHVDEAIPGHKFPEMNAHYRRLLEERSEARRAIYHSDARENLTDDLANEQGDAIDDVAETVPTTLPGLLAMMVYAADQDTEEFRDIGELLQSFATAAKTLTGGEAVQS